DHLRTHPQPHHRRLHRRLRRGLPAAGPGTADAADLRRCLQRPDPAAGLRGHPLGRLAPPRPAARLPVPGVAAHRRRRRLAADPLPGLELAFRPGRPLEVSDRMTNAVHGTTPVPGPDAAPAGPRDTWTPARARAAFRDGLVAPTAGISRGFAQANLIIVPKSQAFDVLLFAQRNPKPCPLLGVLDAGQTSGALLAGGDIRTDVPQYVVYEDGVPVAEPTDITPYWRDDLVTFIVGCSFTFETALQD